MNPVYAPATATARARAVFVALASVTMLAGPLGCAADASHEPSEEIDHSLPLDQAPPGVEILRAKSQELFGRSDAIRIALGQSPSLGIDVLLHSILDRLVDHYQPILEHLQESIEKLEDDAITAVDKYGDMQAFGTN